MLAGIIARWRERGRQRALAAIRQSYADKGGRPAPALVDLYRSHRLSRERQMAKHRIEIYNDDEVDEIYLDGALLMSTNHDKHGWDGMQAVRDLAAAIADARGWDFDPDFEKPED